MVISFKHNLSTLFLLEFWLKGLFGLSVGLIVGTPGSLTGTLGSLLKFEGLLPGLLFELESELKISEKTSFCDTVWFLKKNSSLFNP